jgi:hypothetical protein
MMREAICRAIYEEDNMKTTKGGKGKLMGKCKGGKK